jgi:hypothetical protein
MPAGMTTAMPWSSASSSAPTKVRLVRIGRRVFQHLLDQSPTPQLCLEAFHLQRTRFEIITERKLRRRQLTDDGNVEISGRDVREKAPPAGQGSLFGQAVERLNYAAGCVSKISPLGGKVIHGCLLRTQKCTVAARRYRRACRLGRGAGHHRRSTRRKSSTHTRGRPNGSLLARYRRWSGGLAARPP